MLLQVLLLLLLQMSLLLHKKMLFQYKRLSLLSIALSLGLPMPKLVLLI